MAELPSKMVESYLSFVRAEIAKRWTVVNRQRVHRDALLCRSCLSSLVSQDLCFRSWVYVLGFASCVASRVCKSCVASLV